NLIIIDPDFKYKRMSEETLKYIVVDDDLRKVLADEKSHFENSKIVKGLMSDEETLNMKVRVHGDIGRSVIATRRLIQEGRPTAELDMSVWKDAVKLLRHDIEISGSGDGDADSDGELLRAAQSMGIHIKISGEYPSDREAQAILRGAVRECMTNAVRHAAATELYVCLDPSEAAASVTVTNNGVPPAADIKEGGGLSSLRARVEKVGGTMTVCAAPCFELRVTVPLKR
ncbi:MAG: sensor histidine kinase, partial [Candidatus Avispirillum sp.]